MKDELSFNDSIKTLILTHMMKMIMVSSISIEQVKLEKLIKKSLYMLSIFQRTHIILLRGYADVEKKYFLSFKYLNFNINYTESSNHF